MSAPSSYKPSDMVQSMEVKISTFTEHVSQREINNLHLGNNQIRLTNQAMINHLRNSNLSSLTPSIEITPKYTTLNQQSSGGGAGIPQSNSYTYGTSDVFIDPGNGSNFVTPYTAYIYSCANPNNNLYSLQNMANYIINNTCLLTNVNNATPSQSQLTTNNTWLPNQYGSGHSYWYNCSGNNNDFICEQIILYAVLYAYISSVIQGNQPSGQHLNLVTNAVGESYSGPNTAQGTSAGSFPYNVGVLFFNTGWPFQLNTLYIITTGGVQPYQFNVPYSSSGGNLPANLSGVTTLNETNMLTIFQLNMPQVLNSGNNSVTSYSSSPTNVVSLTPAGNVILMNFLPTAFVTNSGQTTVTINGVSFNATLPSYAINFVGWTLLPVRLTFTSTQPPVMVPGWGGNYQNYAYGQWDLNIQQANFNPELPGPVYNSITMEFTSSNPLLPVVGYNVYTGIPDAKGQYVSVWDQLNNNGQQTTITATAYLFGQPIPNATYSYTYTFTLPSMFPHVWD